MEPRITLITLGVDDLERALRFYRDGLGFATEGIVGKEYEHGAVVFFDLQPGLKLALWPRTSIAHDTKLPLAKGSATDFTVAHNVSSKAEVDAVMAQAAKAGAVIVKPAQDAFWGGYTGYFQDPDGHVWEVAWNPQWVAAQAFDAHRFLESAGDAIVAADTQGNIVYWNAAAERIFGYTRSEALGSSLDLIIPERQRERHWDGYRRVMESGKTRYGTQVLRVPALHKDGRRISIAFTVTLLFSPERRVQAIAAIVRDETERWNEERALRARLAELEGKGHPAA